MQTTIAPAAPRAPRTRTRMTWPALAVRLSVFGLSLLLLAAVQFASPALADHDSNDDSKNSNSDDRGHDDD